MALFSGAALARRRLEVFLQPTSLDVFSIEEHGEVFPDYLVGRVAREAPGFPIRHAPLRVEREDLVILHAFYQRAEVLLAPAQSLVIVFGLGLARLGPRPRAAQPLGQQADECALQEEHEKRHGSEA